MDDEEKLKRDGFYISTPEYALMLGCITEALRSRRRRGELEGEFKTDGKKYWWKSVRPHQVKEIRNNRVKKVSVARSRRRGVHRNFQETKYPNYAFEQHNEIKLLASLKQTLPKGVIDEITPEAVKVAQSNLLKKREKQLNETMRPQKNYGGPIRGYGLAHEYDLENKRRNYQYERSQKQRDNSFFLDSAFRDSSKGGAYEIGEPDDPGAVEIELRGLSPGDPNIERRPINKVEESILRLEIEALKKK